MRAHHRGAAPASGGPGIHLLALPVVQHQPAVGIARPQVAALLRRQPHQQVAAHLRQVPGDDLIIVSGAGAGIGKVLPQGIPGGGGHGSPHVIQVGDPQVHHPANADFLDANAPLLSNQGRPGGRSGMLGRRGPHPAVIEGETELPLAGAEVGGGNRQSLLRGAAFHQKRRQC